LSLKIEKIYILLTAIFDGDCMWWFVSPRIVFGDDAVEILENEKAERVLIVTDKSLAELGYVDEVKRYLKAEKVEVFDEVEPDPSVETALKCGNAAKQLDAQLIIALGGGSVMDVAKMARILMEIDINPEEVTPFTDLYELGFKKKAKLIAIPTTSGTGADVTWAMVLTDTKEKRKVLPANREAIPEIALLDYRFVEKLPPKLIAGTGLDALTHAIEGLVCPWKHDFSDAMCEKAVELVFKYLEKSYKGDLEARQRMHHAATISGLGFGNSQAGMVHSMGHSLGALFKVHHGIAVGLFLPYVLQFYLPHEEARQIMDELAVKLGMKDAEDLIENIFALMRNIEAPTRASELVEENKYFGSLDDLVERAMSDACIVTSPRCPDTQEMTRLFEYAFHGKKVDF
jgi:alcohol dehydrogenase class IV